MWCLVSQVLVSATKDKVGTSLVVQWLIAGAYNAGDPGSGPGQRTRSHMPQLKDPCARTNWPWNGRLTVLKIRWHQSDHWWPICRWLTELTALFLHVAPLPRSHPLPQPKSIKALTLCLLVVGTALHRYPPPSSPQLLASKIKPTFLSANLDCLLAFEKRAARPQVLFSVTCWFTIVLINN